MRENENKIEDIKRHLYDPVDNVSHRSHEGVMHKVSHKVEESWNNKEDELNVMKKPKTSIFKKFFIASIVFFVGAIGFAGYMFYFGGNSVSNDKIEIKVIGNAFTKGGEDLPLEIEITNRNKASIELANLQISYPNGTSDSATDQVRLPRVSVGTIKSGETVTKNISVVLFGEERSNRSIKIDLDYHPEGSNAIFTKEIEYVVNISSAPLSLTINAPETVTSDQPITLNIKATLNTTLPEGETMIQLTYPNNFIYESAIPAPLFGNSMWSLEGLSITNPISIAVKGRIVGLDQDQQVFHVYAGTAKSSDKSMVDVVYNSLLHSVTIVKPFLEANILVNETSSPGENLNVRIAWANNLSTRVTDGEIIANIGGNVFDRFSIVSPNGYFDSVNNRIIWDKNSINELASIEPGDRGEVSLSVRSISLIGTQNTIKDPQITFDISIKGKQPSLGYTFNEINNFSKKVVKILSDFQIASSAVYKSGSLPPKAETETKYDVTWTLSNSTNAISGATARSVLPIYVKWVGPVTQKENITYNESTREVIWNIGSVRANTGSSYNREATFTISITPSILQIGSVPQLMKEVFLSGMDSFANAEIKKTRGSINTTISSDPNFQSGQERVIQ